MSKPLSEQLKQFTKSSHQQLEKLVVSHLRSISSAEEYVKLLQAFYGYFGALEDKIKIYIGCDELPDFTKRRKSESIAHDIEIMGGLVPSKAVESDLPAIENNLQAFGALYVIEGSTLGGKIISQMVAKQLNINGKKGILFFSGYGNETDNMWASFKDALNTLFQNPDDGEVIIHAANDTFLKFKLWIEKEYREI